MPHFPKDWLPILLLITLIAYSVSVEVIEDGTPEEVDMAKALALSRRFFWRTMMENWDCDKMEIKPNEIGVTDKDELRQICESWKVKAFAANACPNETHEGASSSAISPNIRANQIKEKEKPLFRVADGRELQLSSAMEAIKAAYRVLFGFREAKGFNTKFDFVNESKFSNAPMISPTGFLNQLKLEEKGYCNKNYLNIFKTNGVKIADRLNTKHEFEIKNEKLIENEIAELKQLNECFLEYWDSVQELGLDMEMICKELIIIKRKYSKKVGNKWWENIRLLELSYEKSTMKMHEEKNVANVFFHYNYLIRDPMVKMYPDELEELKPLQDPCEEANIMVYGQLDSGGNTATKKSSSSG
uniref:Uncharacterized protein n=1 Tax=Globodera rostochiensis TaxID=31243 RepID=A0A914H494_GLORO